MKSLLTVLPNLARNARNAVGQVKPGDELVPTTDGSPVVNGNKQPLRLVRFSHGGVDYEVNLSAQDAKAFALAIDPYRQAARRVRPPRQTHGPTRRVGATPDPKDVRAWARSNGLKVADRGRLSTEVTQQYLQAQNG